MLLLPSPRNGRLRRASLLLLLAAAVLLCVAPVGASLPGKHTTTRITNTETPFTLDRASFMLSVSAITFTGAPLTDGLVTNSQTGALYLEILV